MTRKRKKTKAEAEVNRTLAALLSNRPPESLRNDLISKLCQADLIRVVEYHPAGGAKRAELTAAGMVAALQNRTDAFSGHFKSRHAAMMEESKLWCERHPKWSRFCDIEDTDSLNLRFGEIPRSVRSSWEAEYRDDAEDMWQEFGGYGNGHGMRHRWGYVGEDGVFYSDIVQTVKPVGINTMMVIEVGGVEGKYFAGGMFERSSRAK